ncbi:MAG: inositol monophosphatase [Rhizobiaceae bacterium]|nr:inositol monophosphatase [Rhizobiaceae bacterium]
MREAAREAGRIAMRYFGENPQVWLKQGASPVSEADYAADKFLRQTLLGVRPAYGWLSEETEESTVRSAGPRSFIVDPIDGTRGFLAGDKRWCVSAALVEGGKTLAGVLECPATGETFEAVRGCGAWLNGTRIKVLQNPIAPFSLGGPKAMVNLLPPHLLQQTRAVAHVPSLAYRLALVAIGKLNATFVKPDAQDWDIAAAMLILEEAGGALLGADGMPPMLGEESARHNALAAGSGTLLDALVKALGEYQGSRN